MAWGARSLHSYTASYRLGLIAEELHNFFKVMGDLHTAAELEPHVGEAERIDIAAHWSVYAVRRDEPGSSSAASGPSA